MRNQRLAGCDCRTCVPEELAPLPNVGCALCLLSAVLVVALVLLAFGVWS